MPVQKITREEILLKSQDVFRIKGYYHTSMNELAVACGLQKGSFYHYFPSKEALMKEILLYIQDYLKNRVNIIAYDETLPPSERLNKLLKKFGKAILSREGGCFIGNTTLETAYHIPDFAEILRSIFDDWINALQHLFKTKYPTETALRLAQQTVMEFEGAVMMTQIYKNDQLLIDVYTRTMARL
jgi:TetR/AcrR family transcriptional regulator, transcriptional repressor for nem operon